MTDDDSSGTRPSPTVPPLLQQYRDLNAACGAILEDSLAPTRIAVAAKNHAFITDLADWVEALSPRPEQPLVIAAGREYAFGMLAVSLGLYRQAFAALRLTLELTAASVYYSANELMLREWLNGKRDNAWKRFTHADNGIYSVRFADAFCYDLRGEVRHYGSLATKVYRECSEFVHGNALTHRALPPALAFEANVLDAWHQKASSMQLAISFALFLRHFDFLPPLAQAKLERTVSEYLGHLEPVRARLGAATAGTP